MSMSRLKGIIICIGGLVLTMLGLAMWRSPQVDWEGFVDAWSMVLGDIARLTDDPFAVLGVIALVIGLWIAFTGLKRVVRG